MSKRRTTPFNEAHKLEYGLEIASRDATTKEVNSVRCKFCIVFGKEGRLKSSSERMRKVSDNIKYFTKPFRTDNYKSHLKTHASKWDEYNKCSKEEKKVFFDISPEKYVNTLDAHYGTNRNENTFFSIQTLWRNLLPICFLTQTMTRNLYQKKGHYPYSKRVQTMTKYIRWKFPTWDSSDYASST